MSFQGIKQTQEDREMLTAVYSEGWIIERELVLGTGENMGSKCVLVMKEPTGYPQDLCSSGDLLASDDPWVNN